MTLCSVCGGIVAATVPCYDGARRCLPCAAAAGFEWHPGAAVPAARYPDGPVKADDPLARCPPAHRDTGGRPRTAHGGHQLDKAGARWQCRRCTWSWRSRPTLACPGVPRYAWGAWPAHCRTCKQLYQAGLQPGGPAIGCYYRASKNTKQPWLWLYDTRTAIARPRKIPRQPIKQAPAGA
jgi:hypothetical protein